MIKAYIESSNIISPLGFSTEENFSNVLEGKSGIKIANYSHLSKGKFPASVIGDNEISREFNLLNSSKEYTRFEKLAILSINNTIKKSKLNINLENTLVILSTTKGNIDLLEDDKKELFSEERLKLQYTAKQISEYFSFQTNPIVVSNACISGLAALVLAQRLISNGDFDNVIVNGTDILSEFVVSGFQSFKSLSEKACKPFDSNRDGLTLGEASATIIITKEKQRIELVKGATSNDANHISGPSRTAEGQFVAVNNTLKDNKIVDFISAHGTATPYNDDMESVAIKRTNLDQTPTNSLKGYFGHTLGAAGVLESIISIESLKNNNLIKSLGSENIGTVENINIIQKTEPKELNSFLKLASGFGGGNAAALFIKHE